MIVHQTGKGGNRFLVFDNMTEQNVIAYVDIFHGYGRKDRRRKFEAMMKHKVTYIS